MLIENNKLLKNKPNIPARMLWDYDYETFNFDKSYKIVIERVMERGGLDEWRTIVNYYTRKQILSAIEWSVQLDERDKRFCRFFLNSDLLYVA